MREFETDSVQIYRNYEDNMLAAEYALAAQYESATELSQVMDNLDQLASGWAASTIFHTDDVSRAINVAAHAGWDYTKILQGIPQAMLIAQAGGLELSSGLDYLITMMNATKTSFSNTGKVVDEWSMAANSSATTIEEMGEAFQAMGASARFGDSTAELFTLLGVLANVGTKGSQAGTSLRSAMMRIIAPTTKAETAMSLLGADAEELNEVLQDENVTKAAKKLQGLGFTAYDSSGELLPMIEIFRNLHTSLTGLEEDAKNEILTAIFPTRTIAAAKAFVDAIGGGEMDKLFEKVSGSEGYAQLGADIMMSGLTGSIEQLLSKWEEFQKKTGEVLAPGIEGAADSLGKIVDWLNNLDEVTLNALVGGLTGLASVGPGLLIAGGAIRLLTTLGPYGTALMLAAMGIGAIAGSLTKLKEVNFKSNFGEIELDLAALSAQVDSIDTTFTKQKEKIEAWDKALEEAETKYKTKATALSEMLLQDVLEGKTLSDEDKDKINAYAQDIYDATLAGLENAKAGDKKFLQALFGDKSTDTEAEVYNTAANVVDNWYDGLYQEAYLIGAELRNKMTEALRDNKLSAPEREAIQATVDRLNEINAAIARVEDSKEYYAQLHKSQRVSFDTIGDYVNENREKQEADIQSLEKTYDDLWGNYHAAYDEAVKSGLKFTDLYGNEHEVSEYDWETFNAEFERERQAALKSIQDKYAELNYKAVDAMMHDIAPEAWDFMRGLTMDENGNFDVSGAFAGMNAEEMRTLADQLRKMWSLEGDIMSGLGLNEYLPTERYDYLKRMIGLSGEVANQTDERAAQIEGLKSNLAEIDSQIAEVEGRMAAMNYSWFNWIGGNPYTRDLNSLTGEGGLLDQRAQLEKDIELAESDIDAYNQLVADRAAEAERLEELEQKQAELNALKEKQAGLDRQIEDTKARMAGMNYSLTDWIGGNPYTQDVDTLNGEGGLLEQQEELAKEIEAYNSAIGIILQTWTELGAAGEADEAEAASTSGDLLAANRQKIADLRERIDALQKEYDILGEEVTERYNRYYNNDYPLFGGEAQKKEDEEVLFGEGGLKEQREKIKAQIASLQEELDNVSTLRFTADFQQVLNADVPELEGTVTFKPKFEVPGIHIDGNTFAEGGRATEPSIFGEGNTAEWAIPEAHTQRTAELLNAAREASGFTWGDLLARYGGLNANAWGTRNLVVHYSPTVNAANAEGVERVLAEDKGRMMRMIRDLMDEQRTRDLAEVYA